MVMWLILDIIYQFLYLGHPSCSKSWERGNNAGGLEDWMVVYYTMYMYTKYGCILYIVYAYQIWLVLKTCYRFLHLAHPPGVGCVEIIQGAEIHFTSKRRNPF